MLKAHWKESCGQVHRGAPLHLLEISVPATSRNRLHDQTDPTRTLSFSVILGKVLHFVKLPFPLL